MRTRFYTLLLLLPIVLAFVYVQPAHAASQGERLDEALLLAIRETDTSLVNAILKKARMPMPKTMMA